MRKLLFAILMGLLIVSCTQQTTKVTDEKPKSEPSESSSTKKVEKEKDDIWTTYSKETLEKARTEKKYILMDFTGSDWCGWCIKLDKEVFSKPEFIKYAKENLVCVEVDFPQQKKIPAEQEKINNQLAQKMGVRGYPTIFILDPNGTVIGKTGYKRGGAEAYIQHIKEIINSK